MHRKESKSSARDITLVIEREHILRDSFEQFRTTDSFDLHKEIKIFYVDEVA